MIKKHPEKKLSEIFVGNTHGVKIPEHLKDLKTARIGLPAYTVDGEEIENMGAIFIDNSEIATYERIMMARFKS